MGTWGISQGDPRRGRRRPTRPEPRRSPQTLRTNPGAGQRPQRRPPHRDIAYRERATRRPDQHNLQARQGIRPDAGTVHRRGPNHDDRPDVTVGEGQRPSAGTCQFLFARCRPWRRNHLALAARETRGHKAPEPQRARPMRREAAPPSLRRRRATPSGFLRRPGTASLLVRHRRFSLSRGRLGSA